MKIRIGFVSNSSSSSYQLYDDGEIAEIEIDGYIEWIRSELKETIGNWELCEYQLRLKYEKIIKFDTVIVKLELYDPE